MINIGDRFEGVHLVTCVDKNMSRPRVKPVNSMIFSEEIRVEFPRALREDYPIGTQFRADVKVAQKSDKATGIIFGQPYLVADKNKIVLVDSFVPNTLLRAVKLSTASDRVYTYLNESTPSEMSFHNLRTTAYAGEILKPSKSISQSLIIARSKLIVNYALARANGHCEGCEEPAPFLRVNGEPYLEVHHITELSNNGSDSPLNVTALCPNCHKRVTFGQDKDKYNMQLKLKVSEYENALSAT